jgi:predicted  nucleic acid-binding Zn-ribbon protein
MIPEEMERLMQFILEHQAQFSVDMDKAKERMAESDERMARIEGIQENTARQIEHLGDALVALTESHERMQEKSAEENARTQAALRELAASQAHTDRRLDALIDIVRGGRGTGQEPPT